MNNSRNKKLLASFLTALGLTTNSANVNVSANFKQFGRDLRFACRILGGQKAEERNSLNCWVTVANNLLNTFKECENKEESNVYFYPGFLNCYQGLFRCIKQMIEHRNGFNSEFVNSLKLDENPDLKKFIDSYDNNSIWDGYFAKVKYTELLKLCEPIYKNARGGKCSVWIANFNKTLKSLCKNEDLTKYMSDHEIKEEQENNVQNNNNNFNMQNQNNFNQNVMPNNNNNNNSQQYEGRFWKENCKCIAKVISDDFKNMNGVLQQAINPAYAHDWLVRMVTGIQKHAIPEIDNAINQNSKYSEELATLKRILQGDEKLNKLSLYWQNDNLKFCLDCYSNHIFTFICNNRHVCVYANEDGGGNPIFRMIGNDGDCILTFDLPNKDNDKYNLLRPQKKQNMNMMGQNNFGMQNNMNNFNMNNFNMPNYQYNNGFNNN